MQGTPLPVWLKPLLPPVGLATRLLAPLLLQVPNEPDGLPRGVSLKFQTHSPVQAYDLKNAFTKGASRSCWGSRS